MKFVLALSTALLFSLPLTAQAAGKGLSLLKEVSGTVIHAGMAVPGATVVVLGRSLPIEGRLLTEKSATTTKRIQADAQGHFKVMLPCWRYFALYAENRKKGLASPLAEGITAPRAGLILELGPAWNLEGRLVYRGGTPGEVIKMRLQRRTSDLHPVDLIVDLEASEGGSFLFRGLPPGPWQLRLNAKKRRLAKPFSFTDPKRKYEIPLVRAYSLTVRAATARGMLGKNAAHGKVSIIDSVQFFETTSDEDGRFVLQGLAKGPGATFLLEAPGYSKRIFALEPGLSPKDPAPQAEVIVSEGRQRKGRILDAMGNPAGGVTVLFAGISYPSGLSVSDLSVVVKTDKNGVFSTNALDPAAMFEAKVILPEGEPMKLDHVVPNRGTPDMGSFRLGSRRVHVTLTVQTGVMLTPDHDVLIYGPKESGEVNASVPLVRTQGLQYRTASLQPGEYVVIFRSKTLGLARRKVFIPGGDKPQAVADIQLMVTRPKLIEGILLDRGGEIVPNRAVKLKSGGPGREGDRSDWTDLVIQTLRMDYFSPKDFPTEVKSDAKGKFQIRCLESSGQYDLLIARQHPDNAPKDLPALPPMRVTNILGRPNPIRIMIK